MCCVHVHYIPLFVNYKYASKVLDNYIYAIAMLIILSILGSSARGMQRTKSE